MAGRRRSRRDPGRERAWRERIERWRASGASVREFCCREKVSTPRFYHWRQELARRQPGKRQGRRPATPLFLPVRVKDGGVPSDSCMEVRLPSGHVLRGYDPEKLARLVVLLGNPTC